MFLVAQTDFGLKMMRQLPATDQLVVSPVSVIFALAMVQLGAKGKTKTQIDQVISKGSTDADIVNYYSILSSQIQHASNGVSTKIANGFFLNKQFNIENQYKNDITEKYSAEIQSVDFSKETQAAETINTFVSETTLGKIKELVEASDIKVESLEDSSFRNAQMNEVANFFPLDAFSVLVNAIYFNAEWKNKFNKITNSIDKFYSAPGKEREITFMNYFGLYSLYTEDQDVQVLSLPYKDSSFAFNIFLPKQRFNLASIRQEFSGEKIQDYFSQMSSVRVTVTIPKMKIENDFKLKEALIAMGVTEMFSQSADLSGIVKSPPIYVSKATHKAIIEVDEDGTTAAAATAMEFLVGSSMSQLQPKSFVADHPFIFVLTKDRNPLFMGQFA